ncbi:hypothetical protein TUM20983_37130 [Mycobacterium antarcticum]|uniref:hypothetical protein n=1 Tax=Mycolicibacterium sp. TUM20983 TaxID=3023369 RepID=UPI00239BEDAA|nr:hypothetical protein [Mycolicibacterium sp. TUM20983]GLP76603.1 hypothetical protein TUM20983_37130 [Mycolicibacterium sp. TUM20983]
MTGAAGEGDLAAIRAAELRIAERMSRADLSEEELTAAHEDAARVLADARVSAEAGAAAATKEIDATVHARNADAQRAGTESADRLRSVAAHRLQRDVAVVLAVVVPGAGVGTDRREGRG